MARMATVSCAIETGPFGLPINRTPGCLLTARPGSPGRGALPAASKAPEIEGGGEDDEGDESADLGPASLVTLTHLNVQFPANTCLASRPYVAR